jgi:integrase/recombinase XerD
MNTDVANLVGRYELAMLRRGLADGTIRQRTYLAIRWITYAGPRWTDPGRELLEAWLDGFGLSARTRYTYLSNLHDLYRWANRDGHAHVDPTAGIERPRLPRAIPRPARVADATLLIAGAADPYRVLFALMADAGLRCCEVAALMWRDVDLAAGTLHVTGKGGHERVVGIPRRLEQILASLDPDGAPVIGRWWSRQRVSDEAGAYLRAHELPYTAHQFRHLYATRLYAATSGDLLAVQHALGHASVTSTQIYARCDPVTALAAARALD